MAMDDAAGQWMVVGEKLVTDPQKIRLDLVGDGDARPDARMNKEVGAVIMGEGERRQKIGMPLEVVPADPRAESAAIAQDRVQVEDPCPGRDLPIAPHRAGEDVVVIAAEAQEGVCGTAGSGD